MGKILRISLKLKFTSNTLGWYGLTIPLSRTSAEQNKAIPVNEILTEREKTQF